jgi:hypothetical protein
MADIKLIREATVEDTLHIHKTGSKPTGAIKEILDADPRVGNDAQLFDLVERISYTQPSTDKERIEAANGTFKPQEIREITSCKVGARLGGFPGEYSIFSLIV